MGSRGGGGSNGGGSQGIPAASRRMVQSLKEIVNGVPEAEIYSTLKDCNMDPNEAVNRLLSQDTFHEVKSKREKKKELKDTPEYTQYRPRGGGSTSNRGGRSGTDRYAGRSASGSNQFTSSEYGGSHGKPAYKRENATSSYTNSTTPASKVAPPQNTTWNPPTFSDSHGHENEASTHNASVPQPYQSAWSVVPPGQKSMADIVKMGRPQNSYNYTNPPPQTASHNHAPPPPLPPTALPSSDNHTSSPDNDWPSMEPPQPVNLHSVTNIQTEPAINSGQSNLQFESNNQYVGHETNEVEVEEESSSEEEQEEDYEDESHEGNLDISAEQDDAPVSSLTANLQNLDVHEETPLDPTQEDAHAPSVVIPGHLQVHTADCSHLSFGSFGVNMNQGHSGHFASTADANPELEPEPEQEPVSSSVEHPETTNLEYYEDGSTRTMDRAENYDLPSASQAALKQEDHEVTRGSQYGFPPATHAQSHAFDSSQLLNVMAANGHQVRESDLSSYSQLMPARYANSASPINDPTISMAEALKNVGLTSSSSSLSSSQHTHPAGPTVPQHLTMHHPYSQPTVPLGPFPNMISYPFLPQSYTYMPSGFQPAYAGNTTSYHQQLAATAMLPQYKNTLPTTLPQSASVPNPPGYASFGGSSPVPGNYEEVLNAHYKDTNNHLLSLQQNEWVHGGGSRTMAVPASAYYNLQSQHHQQQQQQQQQVQPPSGFRQGGQQQQPSQGGYGGGGVGLNYPDFFHSQGGGVSQEHLLQQNVRDGGAQGGQQKLQSQQFWQNGY